MKNYFKKYLPSFLDIIYPPLCVSCENNLAFENKFLCQECHKFVRPSYIRQRLNLDDWGVIEVMSLFEYESPVKELIQAFKYNGIKSIAGYFSKQLAELFGDEYFNNNLIIIPVPLHKRKKRERGFNQAEIIAKDLQKQKGLQVNPNILRRIRYTQTQTELSHDERINNVKNAFDIDYKMILSIKGKFVIILDDVLTTGATFLSCSKAIIKAKPEKIFGLTIAAACNSEIEYNILQKYLSNKE